MPEPQISLVTENGESVVREAQQVTVANTYSREQIELNLAAHQAEVIRWQAMLDALNA